MPQETFHDWDATSSNNTTVTGDASAIDIDEGCAPGNVNDGMRAIMSAGYLSLGGFLAGTSRPSALRSRRFWLNTTTSTAPILTWYDGTDDIAFATINESTNTITLDSGVGGTGLANIVEDTTPQLGGQLDVNGQAIGDGTRELLTFTEDASAVNHIEIENEATGSPPIIRSVGDDAAVGLIINTKSTGTLNLQTGGTSRADFTSSGMRLGAANARVTTILDEDTMSSDSATALATQQSIKAYVDAQGGWTAATAQATTSGTAWSFTGIPSTAKVIKVVLAGVSLDATASLSIQIGDSGGYETTGYISSAGTFAAGGSSTNSTAAFRLTDDRAASEVFGGVITLANEDGNVWSCSGLIANGDSGRAYGTAGHKTLSAALDRVQLTTIAGTANGDAGSVNILYQ